MKTVKVHLLSTSDEIIYEQVLNCYVKSGMYCIMLEKGESRVVHKYPCINIFRVEEDY